MFRSLKLAVLAGLAAAIVPAFAARGLTDPQIAAIVVTANQVDVDAGKLALSHSRSKDVKQFAKRMVDDHDGVNKAAADLVTRLKVKPEPSSISKRLQERGDENLAKLQKLQGAAFDKAYVAHEVAFHLAVLDVVDRFLIPSVSNADLKALLVKVRPAFAAHLDHARHLETRLAK